MYFTAENIYNYRLKEEIPSGISSPALNSWLQNQPNEKIKKINNIMKEILLSYNETITYLADMSFSSIRKKTQSFLEEYEIDNIIFLSNSISRTPKEEMLLIHYAFFINKNLQKTKSSIFDIRLDNQIDKEDNEDIFNAYKDKTLKLSIEKMIPLVDEKSAIPIVDEKSVIQEVKVEKKMVVVSEQDISFMESLRKTTKLFHEFYKENFSFKLKPHQEKVVNWLIERRYSGIIASDTGIGKTLIGLSIAEFLFEVGAIEQIIVICPLYAIDVWKEELDKHLTENTNPYKYVFMNFERLPTNMLFNTENSLLIVDETHRLKNDFGKQAESIKYYKFKYTIALSATIVDKIDELNFVSTILKFKNPLINGEIDSVTVKQIMCNINANKAGIAPAIEKSIAIDLESTFYFKHKEELEKEHNMISCYNFLAHYCSYNNYKDKITTTPNNNKLNELKKILKTHPLDQIIIFTNFVDTALWLESVCKKSNKTSLLYGEKKEKERAIEIENFKTNQTRILISTQRIGGVSMNLQNSNIIIFWDSMWSMPSNLQAKGRILRLNQKKKCYIYTLFYKNSIEETIVNRVEEKTDAFKKLMKLIEI